ncbi:MAG: non-hydrolyzing UDP-N-acetylglucosamine 2-epimerase [Myxococcaceae bacterium]
MASSPAHKVVLHIVGARPNFMKVAPIWRALAGVAGVAQKLVHTGQHYDIQMSDVFFRDLGLPAPDVHLGVGSGSHAEQTGRVMMALETVFDAEKPSLVSVVGDVNSTLAATLVAAKMNIRVAHVEAGLRSHDRTMPEEINRVVTDRLADFLLTPSRDADDNLKKEGVPPERIFFVGNVMMDSLHAALPQAQALSTLKTMGLVPQGYAVCTLHRASNVDVRDTLEEMLAALTALSDEIPVVFPAHPRTRKMLGEARIAGLQQTHPGLRVVDPMGYLEFLSLTSRAKLVLTDSGGLQEEATALGVPCLTLRENTERPVTVTEGTNELVGTSGARIRQAADVVLRTGGKRGRIPDGWDGHAGERIAALYSKWLLA